MRSSRAFRRFVIVYLVMHVVVALVILMLVSSWISAELQRQSFGRLETVAHVVQHQLVEENLPIDSPEVKSQLVELGRKLNLRLTLIRSDGEVVGDSENPEGTFENHGARPEIVAAKRTGRGTAYRVSTTVNQPLYYLAIPYREPTEGTQEGFIRVAQHQDEFVRLKNVILRYLWLSASVLAALSAIVMWRFIQRETEPLEAFSSAAKKIAMGQYEAIPSSLDRNDEWRTLSDAFRHMLGELSAREARLRDNSGRIEAVLTSMIEGVLAIDATGQVILANDAACEMLAIDPTKFLGRKLLDLVRIPALQRAIEETQLKRVFSRVEFETVAPPTRILSARVSVMADGPQPGVAIVLHDVTEIRQLESMRRDFVANVSHELKTPLASIRAAAEILRMGAVKDESKRDQFLAQIETQADLLTQQVQDLLTLAKVESGRSIFNIKPELLEPICHHCAQAHQESAASRSITLVYESKTDGLTARVDRHELATILDNLISNAIRYTPERGTVRLTSYGETRSAVIEVSDTGIGIAPEHLPRIFERFYRVDAARSREMGGTGLGLSIVKHLTQSMGGSVHVSSTLGKGSVFKIKFPIANVPAET